MKKIYETPALTLLALKASDFLEASTESIASDNFGDPYGESFS